LGSWGVSELKTAVVALGCLLCFAGCQLDRKPTKVTVGELREKILGGGDSLAQFRDYVAVPDAEAISRYQKAFPEYSRLAGIYALRDENDSDDIVNFTKETFSWGTDFGLGKYATYIDMVDGKWAEFGGGEIEYFEIVSSDANSITIDRGPSVEPRIQKLEFEDNRLKGLRSNEDVMLRISGPDSVEAYLAPIIYQKALDYSKFKEKRIQTAVNEDRIKSFCFDFLNSIKSGDYKTVERAISEENGIRFRLSSNALHVNNPNELVEIEKNLAFAKLSTSDQHLVEKGTILINQFRYLNEGKIRSYYPDSATVELWESNYAMVSLVVSLGNGVPKVVALIDDIDME